MYYVAVECMYLLEVHVCSCKIHSTFKLKTARNSDVCMYVCLYVSVWGNPIVLKLRRNGACMYVPMHVRMHVMHVGEERSVVSACMYVCM